MTLNFRKNLSASLLLHAANYLIPLLTFPYLIRTLGPSAFGQVMLAQAVIAYATMLTDYGFNATASRTASTLRKKLRILSHLYVTVTIIRVAFLALGGIGLIFALLLVEPMRSSALLYATCYVAVVGNVLSPNWLYQGLERMSIIAALAISARTICSVFVFILVDDSSDYILAALLLSLPPAIAGFISQIGLWRFTKLSIGYVPSVSQVRAVLREGWPIFSSSIATSVSTNGVVFLLGVTSGALAVGYYVAADKLVRAVVSVIQPISNVVYPRVAYLVAQKSPQSALRFIRKFLYVLAPAAALLSLALVLGAEPLTQLAFGANAASETALILKWIGWLPLLIALSNLFGIQTMLNFGLQREFASTIIVGGLLCLIIVLPLTHAQGSMGAAIAVTITEAVVTLRMAWILHQRKIGLFT